MADTQIPYVAPDGTRSLEAAAQLIGRLLFPIGDGYATLTQAFANVPTHEDVARALADLSASGVDLTPIRNAIAVAQAAAVQAATIADGKVALGGTTGPDADYQIPASAVHVVIPQITASRTWSLPDVDGYPAGQDLVIVDEGRFLGAANGPTLTVVPLAGSGDAIAGYSSGLTLSDAGAAVRLRRGILSDVWVLV